ncbi:MAG TPA: tRNA pseudouridine(38-40) synthase TruA [Clostridiales bacterium]|nr:tRNA pseudouridine(38-40) synthase TruA [Clostridiales bacterium]
MTPTNYKLTIQYDGTRYDGWQRQGNTDNTIQGKLESVLSRMAGQRVEVQGAGRTDAGVHALGQVASVRLPQSPTPQEVLSYANRYLPEDIAVVAAEAAHPRFHARLSARGKCYRYQLHLGPVPDVFSRRYHYRLPGPLDLQAMRQAAALLTGTHDFRSFCSNKRYKKSTVRTIRSITVEAQGPALTLTYQGDGFLYNMVRILTGTLIEVGQGQREARSMPQILAALDRTAAGHTAPAQGLSLVEVYY